MTDGEYGELVALFGKAYADTLRKLTHSGDARDLQKWLELRKQVKK